MLGLTRSRKAQTIIEYALLIAVVVAALVGMRVYYKRSLEGKVKESADRLGSQFNPLEHTYTYASTSGSNSTDVTGRGMVVDTTIGNQWSQERKDETIEGIKDDHKGGLYKGVDSGKDDGEDDGGDEGEVPPKEPPVNEFP